MDQNQTAITVKNLYKTFKLPHEKHSGIKQLVLNFSKRKKGYEMQKALNNINFEVKNGEFFGIVGRNGSGKSTLLKLLAGIYAPDKGLVQVNGSLTPFIELGVGFNPELTGRENVFLNGALLGFSRKEMENLYDDIVDFAELDRFMDQKLKNYSSGMQVRLAFSIAIRAKSDILLIDEVLAVGDVNFQNKCLKLFTEMKRDKKTIVFISHDMGTVRRFCDRAIMIQEGKVAEEGSAEEIAGLYETINLPEGQSVETINKIISLRDNKIIKKLSLLDSKGNSVNRIDRGKELTLKLEIKSDSPAKNIGVAIYKLDGSYVFGTNTILDDFKIQKITSYTFSTDMGRGEYFFKIGIFGDNDSVVYEYFEQGPTFHVNGLPGDEKWEGILHLSHSWSK